MTRWWVKLTISSNDWSIKNILTITKVIIEARAIIRKRLRSLSLNNQNKSKMTSSTWKMNSWTRKQLWSIYSGSYLKWKSSNLKTKANKNNCLKLEWIVMDNNKSEIQNKLTRRSRLILNKTRKKIDKLYNLCKILYVLYVIGPSD